MKTSIKTCGATTSIIFCCGCERPVNARLTDGGEIYPHRSDLKPLPFWKCDGCGNFVGCHHKTRNRTRPLGNIPTPAIRNARKRVHAILDPLWKSGRFDRKGIYKMIGKELGREYHTAEISSAAEAEKVIAIIQKIAA